MNELTKGCTLQHGKYKIVKTLGQGGFGITYQGMQTGLNRKVAIKEFFMEDYCEREDGVSQVSFVGTKGNQELVKRFREKFVKEAQLIAGLEDVPHIIRIHDVFEENGTAYYVMQYIEGGSLKDLVKRHGKLDEATAVRYISQVADALSALHQRHIMHLDVKPDNILLKDDEAVLIDFGVSKHYDKEGNATTTTPVARSKGYAPLEQYKQGGVGEFSPETDIYSLGATLFFLLVGEMPPEATELVQNPIKCPSFVPASIANAISLAMKPNKAERLHSVNDFIDEISNLKVDLDSTIIDCIEDKNGIKLSQATELKRIIEQLEENGEYKEAYNRCIDCINLGINVDYALTKSNHLLPIIKHRANVKKTTYFIIIAIVIIVTFILSIIIQ